MVTVHKSAETIQGWKLFKGRNYSRKYGIYTYVCFILRDPKVIFVIVPEMSFANLAGRRLLESAVIYSTPAPSPFAVRDVSKANVLGLIIVPARLVGKALIAILAL